MATQSLFDKHSNYDKKIILLAIKTMSPNEINLLQKGYGTDYAGRGYLYRSEQFSFEMADKKLERRISEINGLIEDGKSEDDIIGIYSKQKVQGSLASYFTKSNSSSSTQVRVKSKVAVMQPITSEKPKGLNKIDKPLEEYFPVSLRKLAMHYIKENITGEDKELLNYFYAGSSYEICRRFADDKEKLTQLSIFINRVNAEVIKMKSTKVTNQVSSNQHSSSKSGIKLSSKKQLDTTIDDKKMQGLLKSVPAEYKSIAVEIVESFKEKYPCWYETIIKKYSGEYYEIVNDVKLDDREQGYIIFAKNKINELIEKKIKEMGKTPVSVFEESVKELIEHPQPEKISDNSGNKKVKGYLASIPDDDIEIAIKIIESFKQSCPQYYSAITKKYSGEHYEIVNNVELSKQEKICIGNSRARLKQLIEKDRNSSSKGEEEKELVSASSVSKRKARGFLDLCKIAEEDREKALEIIKSFETMYPYYYKTIIKRYSGQCYEIINDVKLDKKEQNYITLAKTKLVKLLQKEKDKDLDCSSISTEGELVNKILNSKIQVKGFLDLCKITDEKERKLAVEIIKGFAITYPKYYELITKRYSGEYYEIASDFKLSNYESQCLQRAKQKLLKLLQMKHEGKEIKKFAIRAKGYLESVSEAQKDLAVEIIENYFKEYYPSYYDVIIKRYSGQYYEIINDVKLDKKEQNYITNSQAKLNKLLKQENVKEIIEKSSQNQSSILSDNERISLQNEANIESKQISDDKVVTDSEIHIYSINDILEFTPIRLSMDLTFNYIINHKNHIFRIMSTEEIVDSYIENLEYFSGRDAALIVKTIATYEPSKIKKLISSSYFQNKLQFLTAKEQEYIYLTLLSYSKSYLPEDKISEILEIDKEYLREYEIMTNDENVNKLNILFK